MSIEFRVCWAASSNISFRDATDWEVWDDEEATEREVEETLTAGTPGHIEGFAMALEASGFEWWLETREVGE